MEVMFKFCAGLDVHKRMIVACALVSSAEGLQRHLCTFPATLAGLEALGAWLMRFGCHPRGDGRTRGCTGSRCSMSWRRCSRCGS